MVMITTTNPSATTSPITHETPYAITVQQLESVARLRLRSHSLTTAVAVASDFEGGQRAMTCIHMYHHPFFCATFSCAFFCRSPHHVHCAANPAKKKKEKGTK